MKPKECSGCQLEIKGTGFAPAEGPKDALICFVGEALGREEARVGKPFIGPAGAMLNRALQRLGLEREQVRIGNVVSCQPPNDWLAGAPWEFGSTNHCRAHRKTLTGHRVYVSLGVTATKTLLRDHGIEYAGTLNNWHGTVNPLGGESYLVPSFHPAFLLRGNQKLFGTQLFDIKRAMEVASFGFQPDPMDLVVDPPADWFANWVSSVSPVDWMSVDIETTRKTGAEEDELDYAGGDIIRVNFATNPEQGITVPWEDRYKDEIKKALATPCTKVLWNERFDIPILRSAGCSPSGPILDFMHGWHLLQSSLPKGLGFVAPFYCNIGPWKHLSGTDPGRYAAIDAVAELRCAFGITRDLRASGQWDAFLRYIVKLDDRVLHPAEDVGLLVDKGHLDLFQRALAAKKAKILDQIQTYIPDDLKPLSPPGGWKREPKDKKNVVKRVVKEVVRCCTACDATDVSSLHRCP